MRYANGDEVQDAITALGSPATAGAPRPDGDETVAVRYRGEAAAAELPLPPWLRACLPTVYAGRAGATFAPATRLPPA